MRWFLLVLVVSLLFSTEGEARRLAPTGGGPAATIVTPPASGAPVVNVASFTISSPVTNGGAVGTATATNSPTSWTLTSCSPSCSTYFSISNGGVITTTSAGVTGITGALFTATLTLQATNASGSGSDINTVNAYGDGFANAPSGTPQYTRASFFSGYVTTPSWHVAGVDYRVGPPAGTVFKDPSTIATAGVSVNTSTGRIIVTNANVTLDAYDFSCTQITCSPAGLQYGLDVRAANLTITNSYFLQQCSGAIGIAGTNSSASGLTFRYNVLDGGADRSTACANAAPSGLIGNTAASNVTVEYNWMKNGGGHALETGGGSVVMRFNLLEDFAWATGAHMNYLQMFTSTAVNPATVQYNTTRQHILPSFPGAGGEGFQFGTSGTTLLSNGTFKYNTMLALTSCNQGNIGACNPSATKSMSAMTHAASGTGGDGRSTVTVDTNYLDPRGALFAWYTDNNVCPAGLCLTTYTNNIRMDTGAACNATGGMPC